LFSSASRAVDVSTSKMPPQQPDRLLDLFNQPFDFGAHDFLLSWMAALRPPFVYSRVHVAGEDAKRNRQAGRPDQRSSMI